MLDIVWDGNTGPMNYWIHMTMKWRILASTVLNRSLGGRTRAEEAEVRDADLGRVFYKQTDTGRNNTIFITSGSTNVAVIIILPRTITATRSAILTYLIFEQMLVDRLPF